MERIKHLLDLMEEKAFSAYLLTLPENLYYFTGFRGEGAAIITSDGTVKLYTLPLYYESAVQQVIKGIDVIRTKTHDMFKEELTEELGKLVGDVGFDHMDAESFWKMSSKLRFLHLVPSSELVWKLRSIKDEKELENIMKAATISDIGIEVASDLISPGVTEQEVKAELTEELLKCGADGVAFDIIVASGAKSSLPHGGPGNRQIQAGDVVVIDLGASVNGYSADVTRTFFVGDKVQEKIEKIYKVVEEAKNLAEEHMMAWVSASFIDRVARQFVENAGLAEYFIHSLGHGIGLSVHEPPKISPNSKDLLAENMVVTCEPGVYIPGQYGIRLEDTLLIKKDGAVRLSKAPFHPYTY
ncbi:MAG: Xaa-Pro peptidase family protein [Nitrososphaerota archaeon]|nr:Xaa-Pro peptidase family protein [Aigarchaeota archaeon]MDW8076905.1 Xaa-Pro peptidase family protein [Nitrososphaerota archaeon]